MFIEYPKILKHDGKKAIVRDEDEEHEKLQEWGVIKEEYDLEQDSFRNQLLARAAKLELKIDNRWTDKRLQRVVEEKEQSNEV